MFVTANISIVLLQIGILVILSVGFSTCLWWMLNRPSVAGQLKWLWLGLAGVAVPCFLMQSLVYAGFPLRLTAWPVFGVALVATVISAPVVWRSLRNDSLLRLDACWCAVLFVITIAVQATSLVALGPSRFHGAGHYDQATYVVTAEFLASETYATKWEEVGYRPWMLKALAMKPGRITGIVALGAVATVSGSDSQQAYGAVNVFFVAVLMLAVAGLATTCGLPRWAIIGSALLAGLSSGTTRIYLEGFFSQATSLFVFPALVGILGGNGVPRALKLTCAGVLLAFLIGTYSELVPIGVVFVCALQAVVPGPWRQRAWDLALVLALSLIVNAGYSVRLIDYLFTHAASARNPANLAALFPDSGTWAGWGRIFTEARSATVSGILGVGLTGLGLFGCCRLAARRQLVLPAATLAAGLVLAYMRWGDVFRPYVFAKLGIEFVGVWTAAVFAGIALFPGTGKWNGFAKGFLGALLVLGAVATTFRRHAEVMNPTGRLALLSSERLASVRREAAQHPERAYLVSCNDPLVAEWLSYFGRRSSVVLDRRTFADRVLTTEENACRRWRGPREAIWWLDPFRAGPVSHYEPPPDWGIHGPLETEVGSGGSYHVIGGGADLTLTAGPADQRREVWLDFVVVLLHPNRSVQLQIIGGANNAISRRIDQNGWVRWRLAINPGVNRFHLTARYKDGGAVPPTGSFLLKLPSVEVSDELPTVDGVTGPFL